MEAFLNVRNFKSPKKVMEPFFGIKTFKTVMVSFFRIKKFKSRKKATERSSFLSIKNFKSRKQWWSSYCVLKTLRAVRK